MVWIAAMDVVSPLGDDWETTLEALMAGKSAIRPVETFDATGFPCTTAAWIDRPSGDDRRADLALAVTDRVWAAAPEVAPERRGVFVGAESGRATFETIRKLAAAAGGGSEFDHAAFARNAPALVPTFDTSVVSPAAVTSKLAARYEIGGPARTLSLACSSSSAAIVDAVRAIELGRCDVALAGGVGADVDALMLAGFGLLGALSNRGRSRPFDVQRDGFVVGEGAAFFVLTRERPSAPLGRIVGVGRTLDGHHLTKPHPTGDGARRAMATALEMAGNPRVDYVQAHGTSTVLNDAVEAAALRDLCPDARVSSVKGALGHWIAGAGALGLCCAVEGIRSGRLVPTAGLQTVAPECEHHHVLGVGTQAAVETALANAFAFGGANASLVVAREA